MKECKLVGWFGDLCRQEKHCIMEDQFRGANLERVLAMSPQEQEEDLARYAGCLKLQELRERLNI